MSLCTIPLNGQHYHVTASSVVSASLMAAYGLSNLFVHQYVFHPKPTLERYCPNITSSFNQSIALINEQAVTERKCLKGWTPLKITMYPIMKSIILTLGISSLVAAPIFFIAASERV